MLICELEVPFMRNRQHIRPTADPAIGTNYTDTPAVDSDVELSTAINNQNNLIEKSKVEKPSEGEAKPLQYSTHTIRAPEKLNV